MLDEVPFEHELPSTEGATANDAAASVEPPEDVDAVTPPVASSSSENGSQPRQLFAERPAQNLYAGATYRQQKPVKTAFERIRDEEILKPGVVLGPFRDDDEWQLAKWLIKHVGHTATEEFLNLSIISQRANPSYTRKADFYDKIDSLPGGVKWQCKVIDITGDIADLTKDPSGKTMASERVELWWRDPVECVAELIGNPAFKDVMRYAPERLFTEKEGGVEVINEMWTASWWWEIQKRLPPGCTIAPLILSSDKTMLSNFRGDNSAWPIYLTIGNIGKETRREVSSQATVLIGYLPIPKFDCFEKNTRSLAKYRLFHQCMTVIMQSLVEAGTSGQDMVCADSQVRNVWPIFAAYVADYPEQCLVSCCKENRCPVCTVRPDERGDHQYHPLRDVRETLYLMRRQQEGEKDEVFEENGMRAVYPPFWATLPHSDIFQSFTPDLLHQLHKGVFKDHLVKWCTEIIGKLEVDERFKAMPSHPGVRHFKNGISTVSQWTGSEHKEMEKVFLGLISAGAHPEMVKAVRGLIDFAYFASLQSHTSDTLLGLRNALDTFHAHKNIFIELGGRKDHFNIPKIHALDHYEPLIRLFGSADGFNTESPERLHIDYAKNAYRASNRKDYINQMTLWLTRQESVARFSHYLEWAAANPHPSLLARDANTRNSATTNAIPVSTCSRSIVEPEPEPQADSLILSRSYTVAKVPPRATRAVSGLDIISSSGHSASRFIPALSQFLRQSGSHFIPRDFDMFGTWKRIKFKLPSIPQVGSRHSSNIVRASAPVPASITQRKAAEPAYLDFALMRTAESNQFTVGTPLEGLRIAQVKVIFQLPSHYPLKLQSPLAYIEWFTPLRTPDPVDGYYHISRSTRQHQPYAKIVAVDRIVRNAMLIPQKWGEDKAYLLNSHSDGHAFCLYKLQSPDTLPK
ncbi:hypothetical protein MSAN_02415900 [Mycena sanguinolenta]|uniref:Uncharacterized protein n=1 Tax=Mycena sanguinolenta TaxID=230812 RepID=A0A8H6X3I3_9AGAR|nr:hypothetical protein MSAN_02415900 [Mycena sanguinolenta]